MNTYDMLRLARRTASRLRRSARAARAEWVTTGLPTPPPSPPAPPPPRPEEVIDRPEELHRFWRQPAPPDNDPRNYRGTVWRSEALLELISDLPTDARILEVGCNVGRNLAYLYNHGYHGVEGVEINPHAVELLRASFPELADVEVHVGAAEDVLSTLASDAYDLIFTMAVIEHIHPDSSVVFDEMVRIGCSILAIEPPGRSSHRQYPHNVYEIFQSRGMHLVADRPMADFPRLHDDRGIRTFVASRFHRGTYGSPMAASGAGPAGPA